LEHEFLIKNDFSEDALIGYTKDLTIIQWSKAAEWLLGYTEEEMIGRKIDCIFPNDKRKELSDILEKLEQNKTIRGYESIRKHKNGDIVHVGILATPMHYQNGELYGVFVIYHDISLRKQFEEQLAKKIVQLEEAKKKLEEAYQLKTNFLSYISHEIRTPMNGMIGIIRLLRKTKLDQKQQRWLNMLNLSMDSLMNVINNLLDESKIEADKLMPEIKLCNIKMLTMEIYDLLSVLCKPKRLKTKLYFGPEIKHMVYGDRLRLKQILLNLVDNAVKFTDQGYISLEVRLLSSDDNYETIEFKITDTGIGIDDMDKDKIFKGFTQGNLSIKKKSMGTGLGLSISKKLAQLMNGDITFDSVLGEGSIFRFRVTFSKYKKPLKYVELNDEVIARSIDLTTKVKDCKKIKDEIILVIEDNEINREIIEAVIKESGFRLLTASSGEEALLLIEKYPVDIILTDIQMSGLSGIELTKILRGNDKYRDIPIIAMTGYSEDDCRRKLIDAGLNEFLPKPFNMRQFNHVINKLVD
jgi:PAS domain S-box-containing protein